VAQSPQSISVAFVHSAVRGLPAAARERVLHEAGADGVDALARVPAPVFAALWMAVARELDDEFFGLDSRRMKVGSFALLARASAAERSVGQALKQVLRGFTLLLDDIAPRLELAGREARVVVANRIVRHADEADARRFADETLLVMIHGLLCWLAGRRLPLTRLDWAHERPAHAEEYRRMFSPELHFAMAMTSIAFDARVLAAPVAVTAASLRVFLREAPQSVFLKQVAFGRTGERVRRHLRRAIASGDAQGPGLAALADDLGVSPATLRRRLGEEGTGWQTLKDEVRRELAIQHLADPRLSVEEVASRLGFHDGSAFHRAFRKWTGRAPGAYRPLRGTTQA